MSNHVNVNQVIESVNGGYFIETMEKPETFKKGDEIVVASSGEKTVITRMAQNGFYVKDPVYSAKHLSRGEMIFKTGELYKIEK